MKKIYYFLLLLVSYGGVSQSTDQNFVKTTYYKQANTSSVSNPSPSVATVKVDYLDGMGRTVQEVGNQLSGSGKDLIKNYEFNIFGQITKQYLPYSNSTTSLEYDGAASANAANFSLYTGQTAYSERQYEKSPLQRIIKAAKEGNDWDLPASPTDDDHTKKIEYHVNVSGDQVKMYKASATWNLSKGLYDISLLNSTGTTYYSANELNKIIKKNENWVLADNNDNTVHEFINKEGKLVLMRNFDNNIAHDTYYVYDQYGNLTYVIPPLVSNPSTQLNGLCYQYKYDYRNRLVEKKLPGKNWQFIVYDKLNRKVAIGPNNSPFSDSPSGSVGWIITKYDVLDRPVYNGWQLATVSSTTRKTMQDAQNSTSGPFNESKSTSGTIDGISANYTNTVSPTSFKLLTVNYYDNYNFPNAPTFKTDIENQPVATNVKSLSTGNWTRALTTLSSTVGEVNAIYYDVKGRKIRLYKKNYLGGYVEKHIKLDFAGIEQYIKTYHKRLQSDAEINYTDSFGFSDQGRLLTHTHQIGSAGPIELMSKNEYNEIGQLITKRVGNTDLSGGLCFQKIDYTYNIRGWLTGINDVSNLTQSGVPQDLFAFKINYNSVQSESGYTGKQLYNGNVSETYWKTSTDNVLRKYGYYYDNLHRFKSAVYQKPGLIPVVQNSYNESVEYDKNGNITKLVRNGDAEGVSPAVLIDNLTYTYDANTNQLFKVADSPATNTSGFKDGTNTNQDYEYDTNGNMILDRNKGITEIVYNHLNMPIKIVFGGTGNIVFTYDALGNKLAKKVTQGSTITDTEYLSGFQYKNTVLQFFRTSEGYVTKNGATYKYIYQYKDHLGNARVTYTKNTTTGVLEIIEESHFYPLGLKHSPYNNTVLSSGNIDAQKYKFQEQERQEELGLNWDGFKWRNYDYAIGRFMSVDPLAEKYNWMSVYQFSSNQVNHARELEGMESYDDLSQDDLDFSYHYVYGTNLFESYDANDQTQIHEPLFELDEIVVSNVPGVGDYEVEEDEGSNEDGNDDQYTEEDEKALEAMAENYQNLGTGLSMLGLAMVATGFGAPVGAALMALGGGLSLGGAAISAAEDAGDGHGGFDWGEHAMDFGSELLPGGYDDIMGYSDDLVKTGDQVLIELGSTGSDQWMDFLEDAKKGDGN